MTAVKVLRHLLFLALLWQVWQAAAHPGVGASIAHLDQLIAEHPGQQALYIKRGSLYSHRGQWQLALQDLDTAQHLGDAREASFELGLLHYYKGDYRRAQAELSRYLELHPAQADALLFRARAAQSAGSTDTALADFQTYFQLVQAPQPGDLLAAARLLCAQSGNGPEHALVLLDQGMAQIGLQAQLQRYAVALELQQGKVPAALQRWQGLEEILGHSPQWQLEMAELLLIAERRGEATALLDQALAQLQELRLTPARRQLQHRIERLKIDLDADVNSRPGISR